MNRARRLEAALGPERLQRESGRTVVRATDLESARRAAEILAEQRRPWKPGAPDAQRLAIEAPTGVLQLRAEEAVARVGAGTTFAALDRSLAEHGLRLGASTFDRERTTLGAALATARRGFHGRTGHGLRDRILGLRCVDGGGSLLHAGARVVKNVAGLDLARLHHGARGSLGLVVDLTVRLSAVAAASRTAFVAAEREGAQVLLSEGSRLGATDAVAALWVGRELAALCGLDGEGLLIEREGTDDDLDHWVDRIGAQRSPVSVQEVAERLWARSGTLVRVASTPGAEAEGWIAGDLLGGETWIGWETESVDRAPSRPFWVEKGTVTNAAPTTDPVRDRIVRRLKSLYDPHGLLPPPPSPHCAEVRR